MARKLPPLNALKTFESAARLQSFTLAAEELCVTQGAVSRQVKKLEAYLGFDLFARQGQKLILTAAGLQYQAAIASALNILSDATQSVISAHRPSELLTISVLPSLSTRWLIPRLNQFKQHYPHYVLNVITRDNQTELFPPGVDVVIRSGQGGWPGMQADELFIEKLIPVCHQDIIKEKVSTAADLMKYTLLEHTSRDKIWQRWFNAQHIDKPQFQRIGMEHFFMLIQAACEGLGIALVPDFLVKDDLESGRLVQPINITYESGYRYFVLTKKQQSNPKVADFIQWLLTWYKLS